MAVNGEKRGEFLGANGGAQVLDAGDGVFGATRFVRLGQRVSSDDHQVRTVHLARQVIERAQANIREEEMPVLALLPLDRPAVAPKPISRRLQSQLVYFMSSPGKPGVPPLGEKEYWFDEDEVARWLDEGVFYLVSPLDTANSTEVELSEEQEALLFWLKAERVRHVRVVD